MNERTGDFWERAIIHVDMDAFFASVEQRDTPSLRGKPVAVGGTTKRGVIAAASYESRPYGVRSAMPTVKALRLCPQLILVPPRFGVYSQVSAEVFDIFRSFTPLVEGLSLDEAFLDVTGSQKLFGSAEKIAKDIKTKIFERTSLHASAGVATTKFVAKLASDMDKPNGLKITPRTQEELRDFLAPLPVSRMWGIGKKSLSRFQSFGFYNFGDLQRCPTKRLVSLFGDWGYTLSKLARGEDTRKVESESERKSIGAEQTFGKDLHKREDLQRHLLGQIERAVRRLIQAGLEASIVTVKVKYADFEQLTRQTHLSPPRADTPSIYAASCELLTRFPHRSVGIRLLGVSLSGFADSRQGLLFEENHNIRSKELERTVQDLKNRFGTESLTRASLLKH